MSPICVLLVVILIIVIIVWALFRNTKTPTPEVHVRHEEIEVLEPYVEAPAPSPALKAPAEPDDLTKLEGIGPKANQVLKSAGVTTYSQLAAAEVSMLREALNAAGYRYMDPTGWIEQAKLASEGRFDDLKQLKSKLKGSRKVT